MVGLQVLLFVTDPSIAAASLVVAAQTASDGRDDDSVVVHVIFFLQVTWIHLSSGLPGSRILLAFSLLLVVAEVLLMMLAAAFCG